MKTSSEVNPIAKALAVAIGFALVAIGMYMWLSGH